jgi:hypothetical protein
MEPIPQDRKNMLVRRMHGSRAGTKSLFRYSLLLKTTIKKGGISGLDSTVSVVSSTGLPRDTRLA